MTTVQTMRTEVRGAPRRVWLVLTVALCAALWTGGCSDGRRRGELEAPEVLTSPYDTLRGEPLWAVAPLRNESGVSFVDTLAVSDALAAKVTEVRGLSCVPMNRTIGAMRALGLGSIGSPGQARQLANALGVDGVLVGSVTAYDPYEPPKFGMSLALFVRERPTDEQVLDPIKLKAAYTDRSKALQTQYSEKPASAVNELYDGANHQVQMDLRRYGAGRSERESSLGWRSGLVSMDLYTRFAAHQTLQRLLQNERLRLAQESARAGNAHAEGGGGAGMKPGER